MPLKLSQAGRTKSDGPRHRGSRLAPALFLLLACSTGWCVSGRPLALAMTGAGDTLPRLLARTQSEGAVDVIVGLDVPFQPEGRQSLSSRASQRSRIAAAQTRLYADLQGSGAKEQRRYRFIPYVTLSVDTLALQSLARHPLVGSITPDHAAVPLMDSSNPVIGAPAAWAEGWDGTGQAVAVLDTGVDAAHPWFGGKLLAEACYSRGVPDVRESLCPEGASTSIAPGSGAPCSGIADCDHGTHVAGSAVGNDGVGPGFGVARGAGLVAIQVFTRVLAASSCGGKPPCLVSYSSDLIAALEHVLELSASIDIAAVNISLGGGGYSSQEVCDDENPGTKAAIDNLLSVGVTTAIASGNSGLRNGAAQPGCISSAVTVGATTDGDQVATFSNIADFIDLLAPGVDIVSSVPGGGTASKQGTSMATPHVAGAFAVLRQHAPGTSVPDLLLALGATGTLVDDTRGGGSVTRMPRINVDRALQGEVILRDSFE